MVTEADKGGFEGTVEFREGEGSPEGWCQHSSWLVGCTGAALVKD